MLPVIMLWGNNCDIKTMGGKTMNMLLNEAPPADSSAHFEETEKLTFRPPESDEEKYVKKAQHLALKIVNALCVTFGCFTLSSFLLLLPMVFKPDTGMVIASVLTFGAAFVPLMVTFIKYCISKHRFLLNKPLVLRGTVIMKIYSAVEENHCYAVQVQIRGSDIHTDALCPKEEAEKISEFDEAVIVKASNNSIYVFKYE